MQLVDRIEKRRFVGREFLLWLWFESEVRDATLSTRAHGSFGLWLEKRLILAAGKDSTRISAPLPGAGRAAKEALLEGQLPQLAGVRIALTEDETSFVLKADQLGVSAFKPNAVLETPQPERGSLVEALAGPTRMRKARRKSAPVLPIDDETYERFYERMHLTQAFEGVLEALYADFIALRLSPTWPAQIVPHLQAWARGELVDPDQYAASKPARAARTRSNKRATATRAVDLRR